MPPYGSIPFLPKEITDARPFHRSERGRSGRVRFPPPALAQVKLDFENLSNPNNIGGTNLLGNSITQNGFTVATNSLFLGVTPASGNPYIYTGSVALFTGSPAVVTLTQNNNNPFTLNSIDFAQAYKQSSGYLGGTPVTFTGNIKGGGSVIQTFTHGANDNLETYTFGSAFSNLTFVTWNSVSTAFPYQFDNIVLNTPAAVPEPGSVALLVGMGATGAGWLVRCRRNRP